MMRNILLSKKIGVFLIVLAGMLIGAGNVEGATYYSGGSLTPTSTLNWWINTNATGAHPANFTTSGDVFIIQNGHSMTMSANWAVTGNVIINSGGTLTTSNRTITISGTTTVGSGTSGTLVINSTTGTKNFYGLVTINAGATWNNSANEAVTFRGGITNNGTFTAGTGIYSFTNNPQALNGTISIPSVTVTGVTLTNNGTLTIGTALAGATGTLTNSNTLNLGGTCSIGTTSGGIINSGTINRSGTGTTTTLLANFTNSGTINLAGSGSITGITNNAGGIVNLTSSGTITSFNNATSTSTLNINDLSVPTFTNVITCAVGSTVYYSGLGNQTIKAQAYSNLILSGSGAKSILTGTSVAGNLSIAPTGSATASIAAGQNISVGSLTLGGYGKNSGTWGYGPGTPPANKDQTYFANTTGYFTVTNDTRLAPVFSGLTASQGICVSTASVTLTGTVSAIGPIYPVNGETVGVTINGNTQNATIAGGAGGFTISFPTSAIPSSGTPYTITYSYAGTNSGNLKAATNDLSTTLTVNPLTVINSQSTGAQTQCLNGTFSDISVAASGTGALTYQWYINSTSSTVGGTSLGSGNGAQTANYTPQATSAGTLYYYCIVTGSCGSVTSSISGAFVVYAPIDSNTLDFTNGTHGTICGTAIENANAVLTAPAGTFFINVGFASYGLPNGTCPNFTIGTCHASTSQSVAESYLLGKNTATIPATNAVFGDPCVGTGKKLYVQATYTEPICPGTTPGIITGSTPTGGNGTYVYLWESSTTGSSSGFAAASGTNNLKDYTPGTLSQTTWYRRTVTSGGCNDVSSVVQITVNALPSAPTVGTITQPTCGTATATVALSGLPTSAWTVTASPGGSTITGTTSTANFSDLAANNNYSFTVTLTSSGCTSVASGTAVVNAQPITPLAPITTGGLICIGSTATLSASGGAVGDQYLWYDAATFGNLLQSNVSANFTTPVLGSTTNYWVSILNTVGCEGPRTQVTATYPSISSDNQNASGTDSWVGHVYDGTGLNTYFGSYTEGETFNQSFGGNTACFNITSNSVFRSIYTETFSVRYRMTSGKRGLYVVDLGSDDGSRLTVDGELIYNNWVAQAFSSRPSVLVNLTGSSSLEYDFYEQGGGNQVVFQNLTLVLTNSLSNNISQDICLGSSGSSISGDTFGTLPAGITLSGTGYQWAYSSTSASGPWTDISGAISATYTPSAAFAPFNVAGTYYLMRKAILRSATNNIGFPNYLATNSSNTATLIVNPTLPASVSIGATATSICAGTSVTFTATPTNGGAGPTYQWKLNGSNVGTGGTTYINSTLANNDQVSCEMTSNASPCLTSSPATSNLVTMIVSTDQIANAGPDQTGASTCGLTSVVLAANTPTEGAGAWSVVSGVGGSFGNAASPVSSFSGNPGSTYTLRWTISNLPCASSSDETIVTFNTIPTITGTSPAERCDAGSVSLGATASAGIINWYNDPTGGSSLGTGITFSTPVISSSTTYYVDATSNGCITDSRTAVLATVHDLPTITVSPDVAICSGSNTTLTASGGTSYVWSPSTGLSSSSGASVTASPTATTSYVVTGTDSNICSNTASTTVTVNELPTFSLVSTSCAPDLLSYSVSVTVSSGTLTSTEGTVTNVNGNDWTITFIPTGTNTTLTVTDANSCSNTSIVTAPDCSCPIINAPVSGGNKQYCAGSLVPEISASVASGETVDWYSASSVFLHTGTNYTPSSAGIYYAEARNTTSNCKSSTRTAVTITENPNATISLTSASGTDAQTVCINSPINNVTYLVGGGGTNAGVTGLPSGLFGNFNAGVFTISGNPTASGTFNYTVTTNGTCSQTSANGTVTVDPSSVGGTISGSSPSICLGASTGTLTLSAYTGTIVRWERQINSGGWTNVGSGGNSTFAETPYSSGTWEYRAVVQNGVCAPDYSSFFSIDVDPTTVAGWITSSSYDPICEGASTPTLTLNGSTGNVLRWEKQLNSGAWQNIANTSTTFSEVPTSGGTWGYRALVQSGVCSSAYQTPFTIVVNPTLSITLGSNPVICQTATTASLSYSSTTGSPAGWVMDFDASAISNGFGNPQNGAISGTSGTISINVPYGAAVGIYHATLKVITYYPVCSSVDYPVTVTVNPNLPVSVSTAADINPICAGTNVTFSATPTNGGSTPIYQWQKNGSNVGSNSATYTDATLATGDQITCELTSSEACTLGSPATSNTVTMTVNPNLPVSVSIGASANPICSGTSVTFTATPTNSGSTPTYQWKKNGSNVGSNSTTYTDAALFNGDQITCVLTSDEICASGNPATSNSVTMAVNSFSVAPTGISGTTTICEGGSTTLTLSGGTAGTGATAEWFTGSCGGTPAGTGNSITISPASSTTYFVRYTGTCNTTTCASVSVTVNTLSVAPTGITGTTTICAGSSTTLTLSGGTAGTGAIAEWFTGSCGGTFAGTGNSITISPSSSTTYYVRYSGTCNTTTCASLLVTVFSPSVAPTGISGTTTICEGSSTTLSLSGGTAGTGAIAEWFTGSCGGTSAGTGSSITVSPSSSTTYYVRYSGTCNTTTCASVSVTVNTLSVAPTGITGTTTICAGSSTTLTLSGGTAGTGAIAEWFTGSCGGTSAGTGNSITVSPANSTTYYVRFAGTCNTTTCASVLVTVNLIPTVSTGGAVAAICQGETSEELGGSFIGDATSAIWSDGGAGGSFTNNDGSTPGTATYTASIVSSSTVTLTLTTIGGSCGTASGSKQITVNPIPTPGEIIPD